MTVVTSPVSGRHPDQNTRHRPLQQSVEYFNTLNQLNKNPMWLGGPGGHLVLRRRFCTGIKMAMIARGWMDHPVQSLEALCRAGLNRHLVIISPDHPAPELATLGAVPLVRPTAQAILDLGPEIATLRRNLHQKWRNRLRHAQGQNLRIQHDPMPECPRNWLLHQESTQRKLRRYAHWPEPLTRAFARANPGQARQITAYAGDRPVAAILVLIHGVHATYHIGFTTPEGRRRSAHNLLIWTMIIHLKENGSCSLDLGSLNADDTPGLARFKLGTGARLHPLGGTWGWWPPLGRSLRSLARLDRHLMEHG